MLDKEKVREIAKKYSDEVIKILNPDKIILFGSYVNGTPHEWSDIDIGIIINGFDGDWYSTSVMLQKIRRNNIFIDIEPHLLDEIHDSSGFTEHIIETGEVIYQQV